MNNNLVPRDRLERNPLMTNEGYRLFDRINQHADAPKWTYTVGDRVEEEDLLLVDAFRRDLGKKRGPGSRRPPSDILEWVLSKRRNVYLFQELIPEGFDVERDWVHIPTMSREDLATRAELIVPTDANLSRLIVYDTSGTTGHALVVPHHPGAMAQYMPMLEMVLGFYDHHPRFGPDMVASFNVTARGRTVTFPNVFSVWNQAGFAKVNLNSKEWGSREQARRFFTNLSPFFLNGDPVGFSELMAWDIPVRPAAMLSAAVTLGPGLKQRLESHFNCPVIDWYSTTETGPVAYTCPLGNMHITPHDVFVELLDEDGLPVKSGELGEITVTGGRNPYVPLLRYRTGDWARLDYGNCACGDPAPWLYDLQGRGLVFFRAGDGSIIAPPDVGLALRESLFVQHEFVQRADGSCEVTIRPAPGVPLDLEEIEARLRVMFGKNIGMSVKLDEHLGDRHPSGKVIPFRSEMVLNS